MVTHVISCFWAWTGHLLYFNVRALPPLRVFVNFTV